jgi:hypothetical protein
MCEFVDHTVMENIHNYQELFAKRGGHFEVIGLDMHGTDSKHPFALRRILPIPNLLSNLTRRQKTIEELSVDYGLSYESNKNKSIHFLENFLFFRTKKINHTYNQLSSDNNSIRLFDLEFSEGEFIAKEVVRTTMMYVELNQEIPEFTLDREGFLEKVYAFAGFEDIPIENHTDFSYRFYLLGEDRKAIQAFFNDELVHFFESNPYYHVESNGKALLIFGKERLANIKEIKVIYDFGKRLKKVLQ